MTASLRPRMRIGEAAAVGAAVLAGLALAVALARDEPALEPSGVASASLEEQKLQAEIAKLRAEAQEPSFVERNGAFVTAFVTALVAVGGLYLSFRNQRLEQMRQRQSDHDQRERELEHQKLESQRHLEERFSAVLTDLGSDREAVQAGAAVSLLTFLRREDEAFVRQVRLVSLANLKVGHTEHVRRLLLRVFEQALGLEPLGPEERDLSGADLRGLVVPAFDLAGADLTDTVLTGAQLPGANLRAARGTGTQLQSVRLTGGANLHAVRLPGADATSARFAGATMSAAHLEDATLTGARFPSAQLQSAHLEGADLRGARFQKADLRDTYFVGGGRTAILDDEAMETIIRAVGWRDAHFSPEHRARLDELHAARQPAPPTERTTKKGRPNG